MYEIKNLKNNIGHDLLGYKCNLYKHGKKIATIRDDGHGSGIDYYWVNPKYQDEFEKFIEKEKEERLKTFKPKTLFDKEYGMMFNNDTLVNELVDMRKTVEEWKNLCKKGIVFQVGEQIGTTQYNVIPDKENLLKNNKLDFKRLESALKEKYKDKIVIINKEFMEVKK